MKKYYFGRYIFKNSFIHKLNPLAKLLSIVILISVSALPGSYWRVAASAAILITLIAVAKIKPAEFWPSIRSFRFLLVLTLFIQAFFTTGGNFTSHPTAAMVSESVISTARFALIIAFSAIFTITTTPADIARSLYLFVKPFKIFKVDTKDAAISLLVAIRFIPLLFEESDKIVTAQKLRGAWPEGSSIKSKLRFFTKAESFVIPLFMRVIYYAEQISITLCYRTNLESVMTLPAVKFYDVLFILGAVALGGAVYVI